MIALLLLCALGGATAGASARELQVPAQGGAGARRAPAGPGCLPTHAIVAPLRAAILPTLPADLRLRAVRLAPGCMDLGGRPLQVQLTSDVAWARGTQTIVARLTGARGRGPNGAATAPVGVQAEVVLEAVGTATQAPIVRQGAEVQVVVRSGNVTVQALGVVQEAGALGEAVRVLPQGSARVVRGRVLDARTIEVLL